MKFFCFKNFCKLFGVLLFVSVVVGCAATSEVFQTASNQYNLTASSDGAIPAKNKAMERAGEYCRNMGKSLEVIKVTPHSNDWVYNFDLDFSCK